MRRESSLLSRLGRGLIVLVALAIVAGVVFLMTWDIPAPTAEVELVLPDDRFPK